jgi:hypothetical protein
MWQALRGWICTFECSMAKAWSREWTLKWHIFEWDWTCSHNTKIVFSSWVTTLRGPMWSLKEKHYNLQSDLLDLEMHLYSDVESWNNTLCDLQLLTIGPHTVDQHECTIHLNLKLGLSRSKLFKQKDFRYFSCCFGWCGVSIINLTWYIFQAFYISTNLTSALEAFVNHVLRMNLKVTYEN